MTKKNKQPRDGNGKFVSKKKKLNALYDKAGNVAFFTDEELAGFSKPNNPDCEPATRGYVKCLIRKTRGHTHDCEWDGSPTLFLMSTGWIVSSILGALCFSIDKETQNIGNQYFVPVVLFTILITCMFFEFMKLEVVKTDQYLPSDLQIFRSSEIHPTRSREEGRV